MIVDNLGRKTEAVEARLAALQAQVGSLPDTQFTLLAESFADLAHALDELRAAETEVEQQAAELAAANQALAEQRDRYRDLVEFVPSGYLVTDASGVVQDANRTALRLLATTRDFLVGKPLRILVPPREQAAFQAHLDRLAATPEPHDWTMRLRPLRGAAPSGRAPRPRRAGTPTPVPTRSRSTSGTASFGWPGRSTPAPAVARSSRPRSASGACAPW